MAVRASVRRSAVVAAAVVLLAVAGPVRAGVEVPAHAAAAGVVRLDVRSDDTAWNPVVRVELSPDGGLTWTAPKTTPALGPLERTVVLGGPDDDWGRVWAPADLADDRLVVRLTADCTNTSVCAGRDWFVDWVAVRIGGS